MVQEPESAEFDQMPRNAIATGLVDYVLPPEQMPEALIDVRPPYWKPATTTATAVSPDLLNRILVLRQGPHPLRLSPYRKNMLLRRIQRRMGLWQVEQMGDLSRPAP